MSHASFTDIRIDPDKKVDIQASSQPHPDKPGVWDLRLWLTERPPPQWPEIFEYEWEAALYTKRDKAWVSGKHLVIRCVRDDFQDCHLPYLEKAVEKTNRAYREFLAKQTRATEAEKEKQKPE